MSEKVVLTQEQADAIRTLRSTDAVVNLLDLKGPLSELKVHDIFKALQGWYEIEKPKFQAGDKVTWDGLGEVLVIGKIYSVGGKLSCSFEEAAGCCLLDGLRHATPEEIFWLHELGRGKVGDFKLGDIVVDDKNWIFKISEIDERDDDMLIAMAKDWFSEGRIKGIYPAESFKPMRGDN